MKPGAGKVKGGAYENEICRVLSEWITGFRKPAIFRRTSGSGSRYTKSSGVELECGDIVGITPEAQKISDRYYFECRSYKKVQFRHLLHPELKTALLPNWAVEVSEKAVEANKVPIVIFKANATPSYIMIPSKEIFAYRGTRLIWGEWSICVLSDFLDWLQPESV